MKIAQERLFYQFYECTDEEFAIAYHYSDPGSNPLLDQLYKMNYELKVAKQEDLELYQSLLEFNKDFDEVHFNCGSEEYLKFGLENLYNKDFSFFDCEDYKMKFCYSIAEQYCRTNRVKTGLIQSLEPIKRDTINPYNLWFLLRHVMAIKIGMYLTYNNYNFCLFESDKEFITGDQPLFNTYSSFKIDKPDDFELFYPITPHLALSISKHNSISHKSIINISDNDVEDWNNKIHECCLHEIYSTSEEILNQFIDH